MNEYPHIPYQSPRPDVQRFIDILLGRRDTHHVPLIEYIVDDVVMEPIVTGMLGRAWSEFGTDRGSQKAYLDNVIAFWYGMGYDIVRYEIGLPLPQHKIAVADTAPNAAKDRAWADEHHGAITSWEDFERYPWPDVSTFDFFPLEYLNAHLPEGMGFISSHGGGVYEHLSWIMSFEGMCNAIMEDPGLVRAVSDKLGMLMEEYYRHLLDLDRLVVIFPGDDMGYKSSTMVSPADLRRYILPWHKRFAVAAHGKGVPYFLHSCGNILAIMDDLIDDVQIDGKHSYEDAIIPVQEFQARYGDRIAVLGGTDINILSGKPAGDVRRHVRFLLETCGSRGRYAMGSGNSIPSYVPVDNYLTMIDETHLFNKSQ
jgi:uroporphyrinogen decarboxylase